MIIIIISFSSLFFFFLTRNGSMCRIITILLILLPVCQDMRNTRRIRKTVHIFKVLLGDFERPSSDVGDVFPNQLAGIDGGLVDFLEEERAERLDARTEERAVEGHIDAAQGDGGEAAFESDWAWLGLSLLDAFVDHLDQVRLEVFQGHALHESRDVDVLGLEVVEQVGKAVDSAELKRELEKESY